MTKFEKLIKEIESEGGNTDLMWDKSQKVIHFPKPLSGWSFIGDEIWTNDFPLTIADLFSLRDRLNDVLSEVE